MAATGFLIDVVVAALRAATFRSRGLRNCTTELHNRRRSVARGCWEAEVWLACSTTASPLTAMAPSHLGTEAFELLGILRKKIGCEDDTWGRELGVTLPEGFA